jgi:hypothetical protein
MLKSRCLRENDFKENWYLDACKKIKEIPRYHRKQWEYCYIYQGLFERGVLKPGKIGLGFGVGKEPLVSAFASHGCKIVATDLNAEDPRSLTWYSTNEHSKNIQDLNERKICDSLEFEKLVIYENVDMNNINIRYANEYDFTWSSCAFEHLGSLENGKQFLLNQMKCLRPGGIAIHTTEFNVSSNINTIDNNDTVIYRKRDVEEIVRELNNLDYNVEIDYTLGSGQIETCVDIPPYHSDKHLRLELMGYVTTSIGLIIEKLR